MCFTKSRSQFLILKARKTINVSNYNIKDYFPRVTTNVQGLGKVFKYSRKVYGGSATFYRFGASFSAKALIKTCKLIITWTFGVFYNEKYC